MDSASGMMMMMMMVLVGSNKLLVKKKMEWLGKGIGLAALRTGNESLNLQQYSLHHSS